MPSQAYKVSLMSIHRLLAPVTLGLFCVWAVAEMRSASAGVLDPLMACHNVSDSQARLACFERESAALAAAVSSEACPGTVADKAKSQSKPADEFGLAPGEVVERESQKGERAAPLDAINARVTALTPQGDGRLVFTLDNGQIWRQLVNEGELLAKVGDNVRISRGILGAYFIALPSRHSCKVERVR